MKNNEISAQTLNADAHLAHNGKNQRIAAIHEHLELPKPLPKVIIPYGLQMLQPTSEEHILCPTCK